MTKARIAAMLLVLPLLAGCQSFPFHFGMQERATTAPDMTSYFAQRIEDGRRHLIANRTGAALTAFRQASYHPDYAGAAYNGMAIAYDRLGRYDLAERFFAQAVEASPEDARFARNSARFEQAMLARSGTTLSTALARAETRDETGDTGFANAAQAMNVELDVDEPAGRMQRVSGREVRIAGREDWSARLASSEQVARPAVFHVGRRADVETTALADAGSGYPVAIELAAADRSATEAKARTTRPEAASDVSTRVRANGGLTPRTPASYPVVIPIGPSS